MLKCQHFINLLVPEYNVITVPELMNHTLRLKCPTFLGDILKCILLVANFGVLITEVCSFTVAIYKQLHVAWISMPCQAIREYERRSTPALRHYSDVIMSAMASQITGVSFAQPFVPVQIKENIKAPRHWPLWWESTGDQWIPLHKGPVARKMFPFDDVSMWHQVRCMRYDI